MVEVAITSEDSLNAILVSNNAFCVSKSFIFLKRNYLCCSAAGRCFSLTKTIRAGNFLNETRFCGPYKTTLGNKTAKKAL